MHKLKCRYLLHRYSDKGQIFSWFSSQFVGSNLKLKIQAIQLLSSPSSAPKPLRPLSSIRKCRNSHLRQTSDLHYPPTFACVSLEHLVIRLMSHEEVKLAHLFFCTTFFVQQ